MSCAGNYGLKHVASLACLFPCPIFRQALTDLPRGCFTPFPYLGRAHGTCTEWLRDHRTKWVRRSLRDPLSAPLGRVALRIVASFPALDLTSLQLWFMGGIPICTHLRANAVQRRGILAWTSPGHQCSASPSPVLKTSQVYEPLTKQAFSRKKKSFANLLFCFVFCSQCLGTGSAPGFRPRLPRVCAPIKLVRSIYTVILSRAREPLYSSLVHA